MIIIVFSGLSTRSRQLRTHLSQRSQSSKVVRSHGQRQQLIDFLQSPYHHLAQRPQRLAPSKTLFDAPSLSLTDRVADVSTGISTTF
jgi:hypothetical protein